MQGMEFMDHISSRQKKNALLFWMDTLLVVLNIVAFFTIWHHYYTRDLTYIMNGHGNQLVIAINFIVYFYFARLYGVFTIRMSRIQELVYSQFVAVTMTGFVTYIAAVLLKKEVLPIGPVFLYLAVSIGIAAVWAYLAHHCVLLVFPPKKTLIIYEHEEAQDEGRDMIRKLQWRFAEIGSIRVLEDTEEIEKKIRDCKAEMVMLCGITSSKRNVILKYCIMHDVPVYIRPNIGDLLLSSADPQHMANLPILFCEKAEPKLLYLFVKRLFDILLSLTGLILTSPILLLSAIAIKLYDGGPVFYKQVRLTRNRKRFEIYKFRSMKVDADKGGVGLVTLQDDDRVTPVGRLLRSLRIDELPQLINILQGSMTLVGPRPERIETIELYEKEMPEFGLRLQVKAGLTGYAQVYGKANTRPYDKLEMDLMYIAKRGFIMDIQIILATIKVIFMPESTEGFAEEINADQADLGTHGREEDL